MLLAMLMLVKKKTKKLLNLIFESNIKKPDSYESGFFIVKIFINIRTDYNFFYIYTQNVVVNIKKLFNICTGKNILGVQS